MIQRLVAFPIQDGTIDRPRFWGGLIWQLLRSVVALEKTIRSVRMKGLYYKTLIAGRKSNNCFNPNIFIMSGFEVAGLAMGIVPLLITTTGYYKSILHCLKHHSTERGRLEAGLLVQKDSFLTEISILLRLVTNWEDAEIEEQLNRGYHSKRMTTEVDEELRKHLGISYQSVQRTMFAILEHLAFLDVKLNRVDSENPQVSQPRCNLYSLDFRYLHCNTNSMMNM
jgi:hypothetical protein